jgi:hypothetical protein
MDPVLVGVGGDGGDRPGVDRLLAALAGGGVVVNGEVGGVLGVAVTRGCRRRGLVGGSHLQQHDRDVVGAAGGVGGLDERGHGRSALIVLAQQARQLALVDLTGQPVGAQQHLVAGLQRHGRRGVDRDAVLDSDGAGQHAAVGVHRGFGAGDPAVADHLLDQGVIGGELGELCVAQQVGAAVADMGHVQTVLADHGGGQGRAHARQLGVGLTVFQHDAIGLGDGLGQGLRGGLRGRVARPLQTLDGPQCAARCDLAAGVAPHAVGNGHDGGPGVVTVLVAGAHTANVRAGVEDKGQGCVGHRRSRWSLTCGPPRSSCRW